MKKQLPAHLLNKYLNGECTAQEEAVVKEWYNTFANDDDHVSALDIAQKATLKARMRNAIAQNITDAETQQETIQTGRGKLRYMAYSLTGIAAMLLLAFGLGFFQTDTHPIPAPTISTDLISVTNSTKTIREQVLSDGSHVWLYPGANIRYARKFSGATREISMTGESFFDISKDAAHPFIIHSKHMVTKVWGTSFRVRDGENAAYADVTVVTGKVSVKTVNGQSKVKEVMLHPNEQVTWLSKQEELKTDRNIESKELNIWKKVSLTFDNKPLKEVLPVLNKQFNVNITSADENLNNYLLDADFNGLNFASVMEILKKSLNVSYEIDGTTIVLKNNNN